MAFSRRIKADLEIGVRGQSTQCVSAQADAVDRFVDGDVPLFGGVHGPALADAVVLRVIVSDSVATHLEPNEVGHHAAAGQISTCLGIVAAQIGEPAHHAPLQGHR